MLTVSIIGPDGVGKTTIVKRLQKSLPLPVKYIYMGDNVESCNYILPTSRWWKLHMVSKNNSQFQRPSNGRTSIPEKERRQALQLNGVRRGLRVIKKSLGFVNRILDLWYRHLVAFYFSHRGYVVLFDRHFLYDYYHFDVEPEYGHRPFKRRLHGFLLKHTIPDPDLVICLDAPADVIFNRKREFSVEFIESRRTQYKSLQSVIKNFTVVNTNQKLDSVIQEISQIICNFAKSK